MERSAPRNKGFTLIELMIAVLIIMISMLALSTAITASLRTNTGNEMRNVVTRVTNQTAEALLALPLEDAELSVGPIHSRIAGDATQTGKGIPDTTQQIRNYTFSYQISWTVTQPTPNLKQIAITVTYTFPANQQQTNTAIAYKYRAE